MDFYSVVFAVLCIVSYGATECPPVNPNDGSVIDYVLIPEGNYDRNYSDYNSENKRPLGYAKTTVYYEMNIPNPCIKVTNAQNRMFEVMVETVPSSNICLKLTKNSEQQCGNHILRSCDTAPSDTVYVELFCPNCDETDVNLWYRIRMSDMDDNDIENWCSDVIQEYPSELIQATLPSGFTFPPNTRDDNNGPIHVLNSTLLFYSIVLFLILH